MMKMRIHARSTVWLILACTTFASASQNLLRFAHDILFPGVSGEFRSTSVDGGHRPTSISAGFHLNPPPQPKFGFPLPPLLPPRSFSNRNRSPLFPPPPHQSANLLQPDLPKQDLFTPNTKAVRPESEKQYQRYLEALNDEANPTTDDRNSDNSFASTPVYEEIVTPGARSRAYVNMNVQGKEYSYST